MITDEDLDKLGARPLTVWDRVKAVGIVTSYPLIFFFQFAKFFVPSHPQYDFHWRQKAMLASIRAAITFQSEKRIGYAAGHATSTNDRVRDFATKHKDFKHREVSVSINPAAATDNPATGSAMPQPTLHFLSGPWITGETDRGRDTGPVIFYSHGGGYLDPIIPNAHIPLAQSMAKACGARQVIFISYALCPDVQYPAQLVQIVESMRFLLEKEATPPEDLILAGDSAGAHMMASLMAHMVEPAPYVPPLAPALRGGQLRAAVLLSPWFTWTDAASLGTTPCDYLEGPHAAHLVGVLRPKVKDVWCEIVAAPGARDVWARVFATGGGGSAGERPLVKRMLVTASDSEIMYRDARVFAVEYAGAASVVVGTGEAEAQLATVRTEPRVFAVGRRETHVQPGLDEAVKYYGGGTWRALQAFMSSLQDGRL